MPDALNMQENMMLNRWVTLAVWLSLCLVQPGGTFAETNGSAGYRLSGPVTHGNLAIYFIHGTSRAGPVPLTLQEALAQKVIEVRETSRVNELEVINTGSDEVFIQSGDIVKGGKQDRVLSTSLLLPPNSGPVPVPSFCVESGRWSVRAGENAKVFSSANVALPSREAKLELASTVAPQTTGTRSSVGRQQQEIWRSVAKIQGKLSANLGTSVASMRSQTSLQLALENSKLEQEVKTYVVPLLPSGTEANDSVGYAYAINGKVNSADIYPSNGLFRKMWPKLLRASATEAIGGQGATSKPVPTSAAVTEFIDSANRARSVEVTAGRLSRVAKHDSARALVMEARPAAVPTTSWIHRTYLAK
jgi:hypothetical protein